VRGPQLRGLLFGAGLRQRLTGNSYYGMTAGLNWKPEPWITIRPNVRYDWTDNINLFNCRDGNTPGYCADGNQWLLSTDVILIF